MKKYKLILILAILSVITFGGVCKGKGQDMSNNNGYDALWDKLQNDMKSNNPKDVIDDAYKIFNMAKDDGSTMHAVNAMNYILEYRLQLSDTEHVFDKITLSESLAENPKLYLDIIMAMEIESLCTKTQNETLKYLMMFIAGRIWQKHLESDYSNIAANNAKQDNESDDVKFWSFRQYHDKIVSLYAGCLSDKLQSLRIADCLPILSIHWCKPDSSSLRQYEQTLPNMFDVLAFEIMPYFRNYFIKHHLELSDSKYFCSAADFAAMDLQSDIQSQDELLSVINPLKLFQKMTAEHIKDKNPTAIDYINLRRYDYLSSHYRNTDLKEQKKSFLQMIYDNAHKNSSSYGIVSARMAKSILDETDQDDGTNEETKYLRKKAAEILEKGIKNSPKDTEGAMICQSYLDNMKVPEFSFQSLDTIPPNQPTLIQATYRNMDDTYLWVFKVDRDLQDSHDFYQNKEHVIQKIMTGTKPAIQRKQALFNDGLFHKHKSHIVIDPLPAGHYIIIAANNDDPKKISEKETQMFYSFVTVTAMSVIERQVEGYHERGLYIVDRTTGQPIENVEVTARYSYRGKNDIFIAKKKTDKTGYVHFNWFNPKAQDKPSDNSDENASNPSILDKVKKIFTGGNNGSKDTKKEEKTETEINEYGTYFELRYGDENIIVGKNINRHFFSSYNTIYRKDYRTEFLLDRAIYRPGQRVYFKCIVYDNDEKHVIPNKDVNISVVDPNN
ncbi:MAG: hypothetical protein J6W76_04085, partial [Spirochaetales bacterium]|nr:hypothetical protein [Spirochaetales bacterium]